MKKKIIAKIKSSDIEIQAYKELADKLEQLPISKDEILLNIPLFLTRSSLSHILFFNDIYSKIINKPGVIMEFGSRWGRNLSLMISLRSIFEPYNITRRILGFDTFKGIPHVSKKDKNSKLMEVGSLNVSKDYDKFLDSLLSCQEKLSPRPNLKNYQLMKGDALKTLPKYLKDNPETIVSLVYFDLVNYRPTKKILSLIKKNMVKGGIIAFDDFMLDEAPGETIAFKEEIGLINYTLHRSPYSSTSVYIVI